MLQKCQKLKLQVLNWIEVTRKQLKTQQVGLKGFKMIFDRYAVTGMCREIESSDGVFSFIN